MRSPAPPRLLHFRVSHYNEKVRWALDWKRWPHVRTALAPGLHVPRVRLLTGQTKVPVLVLDGQAIYDSRRILAEIELRRPDPPLFPGDPEARGRALSLARYFDEEVAPDVRRLFWSTYVDDTAAWVRVAGDGFGAPTRLALRVGWPIFRPVFSRKVGLDAGRLARARRQLAGYLDRIEAEIRPSGYLVGDRFTVADLTAAAVMTAVLRPPEFPYPLPEPWPQALLDLRASIMERPGARWVFDIYARHRGASCEIQGKG